MRKLAGIIIVILLILLLFPWALGLHIAKRYSSLLNVYRASGFDVQVVEYQRGWFSSHAKIILTIQQSDIKNFLNGFGLKNQYEFEENIQHGPIIYRPLHGLSTLFGLVSIAHQLKDSHIEIGDFIGFTGCHLNQIQINSIDLPIPNSLIQVKLHRGLSHIWITDDLQKMKGELRLEDFQLADDVITITMPHVKFTFDQHDPNYHYLLGKNKLSIPHLEWTETSGRSLVLTKLISSGFIEENKGALSLNRKLNFDEMKMEDDHFGPVKFELTAEKLDVDSIKNVFDSYVDIEQNGELYESQLQQKMLMLLPTIVMEDTVIKFNDFDITTPKGKFSLEGMMQWKEDSSPDDISDLLQSSNANVNLKISKKLAESWIHVAARMPYFNQASDELDTAYWDARQTMQQNMRMNAFLIASMTTDGTLMDEDALNLLELQKDNVTLDSYQQYLQKLYLNRNILRETNYRLFLGYLEVVRPMQQLLDILQKQKDETLQSMHLQWQDWIKAGYIKENGDTYQISLIQNDGKLVVSGKAL